MGVAKIEETKKIHKNFKIWFLITNYDIALARTYLNSKNVQIH